MARTKNPLLKGTSGAIGNFVVKGNGIVTKMPDMSKVKPSGLQQVRRNLFREAVAYAKGIIRNPEKKAEYEKKLDKDKKVYNAAIREYMMKAKGEISET